MGDEEGLLMKPGVDPRYHVETAARVVELLEAVAAADEPVSVGRLGRLLGWSKPAVYRMVRTLEASGALEGLGGHYVVGRALIPLGQAALRATLMPATARRYMERLQDQLRQTVVLTILDYDEVVCLDRVEGAEKAILPSRRGTRRPAYCTATGHALLSGLSDDDVVRRLSGQRFKHLSPKTLQTMDELLDKLAQTRARGYAINDGEYALGYRAVAAPVRDHTGRILGAVSILVAADRVSYDELIDFAADGLMPTVERVSYELGAPRRIGSPSPY